MVGEGKPFDWNSKPFDWNGAANSMTHVPRWYRDRMVWAIWCLFIVGACFGAIAGHLLWK